MIIISVIIIADDFLFVNSFFIFSKNFFFYKFDIEIAIKIKYTIRVLLYKGAEVHG